MILGHLAWPVTLSLGFSPCVRDFNVYSIYSVLSSYVIYTPWQSLHYWIQQFHWIVSVHFLLKPPVESESLSNNTFMAVLFWQPENTVFHMARLVFTSAPWTATHFILSLLTVHFFKSLKSNMFFSKEFPDSWLLKHPPLTHTIQLTLP